MNGKPPHDALSVLPRTGRGYRRFSAVLFDSVPVAPSVPPAASMSWPAITAMLALKRRPISGLRAAPALTTPHPGLSLRTSLKVGSDGRVPIGNQRFRLEHSPGSKVILCLHPTGHQSVLAAPPDKKEKPVLLFTNCSK